MFSSKIDNHTNLSLHQKIKLFNHPNSVVQNSLSAFADLLCELSNSDSTDFQTKKILSYLDGGSIDEAFSYYYSQYIYLFPEFIDQLEISITVIGNNNINLTNHFRFISLIRDETTILISKLNPDNPDQLFIILLLSVNLKNDLSKLSKPQLYNFTQYISQLKLYSESCSCFQLEDCINDLLALVSQMYSIS